MSRFFDIWLHLKQQEAEIGIQDLKAGFWARSLGEIPEFDTYVLDLNKYSGFDFVRDTWLDQCGQELLFSGKLTLQILDAAGDYALLKQSVMAAMTNVLDAHTAKRELSPAMHWLAGQLKIDNTGRDSESNLRSYCYRVADQISPALRQVQANRHFAMRVAIGKFLLIVDHYNDAQLFWRNADLPLPSSQFTLKELRSRLLEKTRDQVDPDIFLDEEVIQLFGMNELNSKQT